jgi:membrane-associated phospholipid phosphatase
VSVPLRDRLRLFLRLGTRCTLLFALAYGLGDLVTGLHRWRLPVALPFELGLPFVPSLAWAYLSLYPLFACAPLVLRRREELEALAAAVRRAILVAGPCFLLLPAEPAWPPPAPASLGPHAAAFHLADQLNLRYNLVPSLHVAFAVACALSYARARGAAAALVFGTWALLIAASTVLLHQHHLVDVATGAALAAWVSLIFGDPTGRPGSGPGAAPRLPPTT